MGFVRDYSGGAVLLANEEISAYRSVPVNDMVNIIHFRSPKSNCALQHNAWLPFRQMVAQLF